MALCIQKNAFHLNITFLCIKKMLVLSCRLGYPLILLERIVKLPFNVPHFNVLLH